MQIQQAGTYTAIRNKSKRDSHYQQVIRHQSKQLESGNFYKFSDRTVRNSHQRKTSSYLKLILKNLQLPQKCKSLFWPNSQPPSGPLLNYSEMVKGSSEDIFQRKNMHGCNVLVHQSCERGVGGLLCYISLLEAHRS